MTIKNLINDKITIPTSNPEQRVYEIPYLGCNKKNEFISIEVIKKA